VLPLGVEFSAGSRGGYLLSEQSARALTPPVHPRSTGCGTALQQWVEEMAPFLKAIDPNHLVTIGEEGFYSTTCERRAPTSGPGCSKRARGRGRARGAAPARAGCAHARGAPVLLVRAAAIREKLVDQAVR